MYRLLWVICLSLASVFWVALPGFAAQEQPAIVLSAFGTSTAARETYRHIDQLVRQRFPGHEVKWAFTSKKIRQKVASEQGEALPDLPQVLAELKKAGVTRVAVQSLHVVPGEEWEVKVREACRTQGTGITLALGRPLLADTRDQERVLEALARTFPSDLSRTAVVLVGHGSPHPQGEAAYLDFDRLLRARYPRQAVFLGVVQGKPEAAAALRAVQQAGVSGVKFIPLLVVAGEHVNQDILGDGPDSWKSRLLAKGAYQIEGVRQGLGYRDDIMAVFGDHLAEALAQLNGTSGTGSSR